ncbi:coiled-coil domain-containing protein R3HCC1L isoform X1 [Dioscorea cayenensis subsp. rotundata]|uniref:Coiled-coil domain-containing protein R3HCC1L isoform X1 n=1 Tax=Dioscorea cayennensis subsp. rotundata TaxID=55577 RepID=A0AB40BH06_DIOCR|nr:coiled-coil domain-containing protein R3HCC1L isoform X1 [Dioscorea cayenensis subsp. rotundata]
MEEGQGIESSFSSGHEDDGGSSVIESSFSRIVTLKPSSDSKSVETRDSEKSTQEDDEDDWEAIADRGEAAEASSGPSREAGVSSVASEVSEDAALPRRRGRGFFLYQKSCLYSEQKDVPSHSGEDSDPDIDSDEQNQMRTILDKFGTRHALVLYDFPPSTRTTDLEKLLERFKEHGFAIRWVDDTTALAVFRTPEIASEAQNNVKFPFKVRILKEDDIILSHISIKDLDPPYTRPKTSVRTAQRLIAQGMGMKPSTMFGSSELRKQEEARKVRIQSRQNMRDDAWGSD